MSNRRENIFFSFQVISLCLSIGSFIFIIFGLIGYIEERSNEKNYLLTRCYLNGTIKINEKCKDDICWWPISSGLCPSTYRLCLKSIYIIIYGDNQKTFTDIQPLSNDNICYHDKTKFGIIRWNKPQTKEYLIEFIGGIVLFVLNISSLIYLKSITERGYRILPI